MKTQIDKNEKHTPFMPKGHRWQPQELPMLKDRKISSIRL
jgi:hypothetical protein